MTERGDPRAIYDVAYGCNPDTDAVQTELVFKARADVLGGHLCVRLASGDRHEFRYSPPGNTSKNPYSDVIEEHSLTISPTEVDDPARLCIKVSLAIVHP